MNENFSKILASLLSDESDNDVKISSDEEDDRILISLVSECLFTQKPQRIIKTLAEKRINKYSSEQFYKNFGIERSLAILLIRKFEHSSIYRRTIRIGVKILTAKCHLFILLWYLNKQNVTIRNVANFFGISFSTAYAVLIRVSQFLYSLENDVIKWPDEFERKDTSNLYLRHTGISGIIGVVGNFNIKTNYSANRNDFLYIPVQAVCNAKNKFIDVFIGDFDHIVEDTLFENSNIVEKLYTLSEDEHIVGNLNFPCLQNLTTPVNFHDDINFCINQIEECFKRLKQKFKHLRCLKMKSNKLKMLLIKSCFILYNLDCHDQGKINDQFVSLEHNYCG